MLLSLEADKPLEPLMREISLQPGDLSLVRQPARIATILGSCVAFTMRHQPTGMAAMSHCLLPTRSGSRPMNPDESRYAYVDWTVEEMLGFFSRAGVPVPEIEVKLFGGSDVLQMLAGPKSVGRENLNLAMRLVQSKGLNLLASDVGGPAGRKIAFETISGRVRVYKMRSAAEQIIFQQQAQPAPCLQFAS